MLARVDFGTGDFSYRWIRDTASGRISADFRSSDVKGAKGKDGKRNIGKIENCEPKLREARELADTFVAHEPHLWVLYVDASNLGRKSPSVSLKSNRAN